MVSFGLVVSEEKTFKESAIQSSLFVYSINFQVHYNCDKKNLLNVFYGYLRCQKKLICTNFKPDCTPNTILFCLVVSGEKIFKELAFYSSLSA